MLVGLATGLIGSRQQYVSMCVLVDYHIISHYHYYIITGKYVQSLRCCNGNVKTDLITVEPVLLLSQRNIFFHIIK